MFLVAIFFEFHFKSLTHCLLALYGIIFLSKFSGNFNKKSCWSHLGSTHADLLGLGSPPFHQITHRNRLALLPSTAPLVLFFP